jgi:DNA-binding MarR family transcriptional regulator
MAVSTQHHCGYVVNDEGLASWSDQHADAWIGLLETTKVLTRALDADLEAKHGLGLSAVELLSRLAAAPGHRLRLSVLATEASLSLSRVSRIVDALESRGLLTREPCPKDARAINAQLSDAGLALVREAQATHFALVQAQFFDRLSDEEVRTLATVFGRLAPRAAAACTVDQKTGVSV